METSDNGMPISMQAYIGMPCYSDCNANPFGVKRACLENGLMGYMTFAFEPLVCSDLSHTFNMLWCQALNNDFDLFFMLHSDIVPDKDWCRTLWEIMQDTDADVVSVLSPIKDEHGIFSAGISTRENRWKPYYRFSSSQVQDLPETFSIEDTDCPDKILLVNTGCMLIDLRKPWVRESNPDGSLAHVFDFRHRVIEDDSGNLRANMEPEDWRMSRFLASRGAKVYATKAVGIYHVGTNAWDSKMVWGPKIDHGADPEYVEMRGRENAKETACVS